MSWKRPLPTCIGHCGVALQGRRSLTPAHVQQVCSQLGQPLAVTFGAQKAKSFFFSFSAQFAESIERGDNKGHRDKVPLYQCAGAHSKFALNAD